MTGTIAAKMCPSCRQPITTGGCGCNTLLRFNVPGGTLGTKVQGWICPKCGRSNAPWLPYCDCTQQGFSAPTDGKYR